MMTSTEVFLVIGVECTLSGQAISVVHIETVTNVNKKSSVENQTRDTQYA